MSWLPPPDAFASGVCEQELQRHPKLFHTESVLLAAATVEAMLPDQTYKRTAAIRNQISEPEPEWIREIRLRLDSPNQRAEHRVVSYAWSSAGVRNQ